jgi:hypothetical protein
MSDEAAEAGESGAAATAAGSAVPWSEPRVERDLEAIRMDTLRVLVLSDPARGPEEVASPEALVELATAGPAAASADLPALLQSAYEFIRENAAGTTEIWICSDQRANDWKPDDGGWSGIRDALAKLPQQVRVQLLSYATPAQGNVAVRVSNVKLETLGRDRRLVVTVTVARQEDGARLTVPVRFEIGGVSTSVDVELAGREAVLKNHVIPLERSAAIKGFGTVSIPADADPADNEFFFVYDEPPPAPLCEPPPPPQ